MSEEATAAAERRLAERGMTMGTVPPEVAAAFRQISNTMAEEWAGRAGEDGRKLLDALRGGGGAAR
jgi:TRAP-type C4-dicarboxylate transport system substrate-binding protein